MHAVKFTACIFCQYGFPRGEISQRPCPLTDEGQTYREFPTDGQ